MDSRLVKQLSHIAFFGGIASILTSAAIYLTGQKDESEGRHNAGVFVGLWAPTFFAVSEMLDRLAVQDSDYLGVPIERGVQQGVGDVIDKTRSLIKR